MTHNQTLILIALSSLLNVVCLGLGFYLGYAFKDVKEQLKRLWEAHNALPEPVVEIGATPGVYHTADPKKVNDPETNTGAVVPKTPARLEFEEQQRIMKMQEQVARR
jgi:hypothetical protein